MAILTTKDIPVVGGGGAISCLHVAPEPCFDKQLKKLLGNTYITADLYNPDAMVKMDIMDIDYPDESFDAIICNHVLEHVADDQQAMREFHRVLKPGGYAILMVPVADIDRTYEDFTITSAEGRSKAFGQCDHVRKYGKDYADRLRSSGFAVHAFEADDLAGDSDISRMKLLVNSRHWANDTVFYCTKHADTGKTGRESL
ncbi:MAG: methyltransferase domain-containing protein [Acidobacteriota bacterium]|jgi:SAM-dependent methyltransferase|nr:methyltransferase domain-containing protein [Acidobacteriota bacterium]